jgi:hypothetical protein
MSVQFLEDSLLSTHECGVGATGLSYLEPHCASRQLAVEPHELYLRASNLVVDLPHMQPDAHAYLTSCVLDFDLEVGIPWIPRAETGYWGLGYFARRNWR